MSSGINGAGFRLGVLFASILAVSCSEHISAGPDAGDGSPDVGMDADGDADLDSDSDGDSDFDGDADADGESSDADPDSEIETCGDEICDAHENAETCPDDCGVFCSDGVCTHDEDASSCPEDCPEVEGDGACTHTESYSEWSDDCPSICGDGVCDFDTERFDYDCPKDCLYACGNGLCDEDEVAWVCPDDCAPVCGDGECTHWELGTDCSTECHAECDGSCWYGRDRETCPMDCPGVEPCRIAGELGYIMGRGSVVGSNATGRDEEDWCGVTGSQEVIYSLITVADGETTISLDNPGTSLDASIAVIQYHCFNEELACSDDALGGWAQVTFSNSGFGFYYVVIQGRDGATGDFELTVHSNGGCDGEGVVADIGPRIADGTVTVDTSASTSSLTGSCPPASYNYAPEAVLTYTAPRDGVMVASTNFPGTDYDTLIYVREGDCDYSGAEIACNDDDEQPARARRFLSEVEHEVTEGTTYYLVVDGFHRYSGTAEVGLGYGGTSPVEGELEACGADGATDVYRTWVEVGESFTVSADTVSADTAADLCLQVYSIDGTTLLADLDDEMECLFPFADGRCPRGAIEGMPVRGFVYVHVGVCSDDCASPISVEYELSVERSAMPARLMAVRDE